MNSQIYNLSENSFIIIVLYEYSVHAILNNYIFYNYNTSFEKLVKMNIFKSFNFQINNCSSDNTARHIWQ